MGPAGQRRGARASGRAAPTRGPGLSVSAGLRESEEVGRAEKEQAGLTRRAGGRKLGLVRRAEKKGKRARARLKEGLG